MGASETGRKLGKGWQGERGKGKGERGEMHFQVDKCGTACVVERQCAAVTNVDKMPSIRIIYAATMGHSGQEKYVDSRREKCVLQQNF